MSTTNDKIFFFSQQKEIAKNALTPMCQGVLVCLCLYTDQAAGHSLSGHSVILVLYQSVLLSM